MKRTGAVYLVGAGPGNAGLLTVRGKHLIEHCDFLIYDNLIHSSVIDLAPETCEKIYVGKKARARHGMDQGAINRLLVRLAREGKRIVRLKGGDPFVFGRGGEEALALRQNKIPFEIVPGVSAGFGAAAYAGIPVTHRKIASDVTFVTAHEDPMKGSSQLNWEALAALRGTLVIYMGTNKLERISERLIQFGKDRQTPSAVIEWGATPKQRIVTGTLKTIAARSRKQKMSSPTVIIVGPVVGMAKKLRWYESKPLFGKSVLITRSCHQAGGLRSDLEDLGAEVIEFSTIETSPVKDWGLFDEAMTRVHEFDFLVLTSENGVSAFLERLQALGHDVRSLKGVRILAIGAGTAKKLSEGGILADLIPDDYSSVGLIEAIRKRDWIHRKRYLLLRTTIAPKFLSETLKNEGAHVTEISVYETRKPKNLKSRLKRLLNLKKIDFLTFTSSSTAENFFGLIPTKKKISSKIISIGPVTSQTIKKFGFRVSAEANPHTIPGLVEAVLKGARIK